MKSILLFFCVLAVLFGIVGIICAIAYLFGGGAAVLTIFFGSFAALVAYCDYYERNFDP